MTGVLFGRGGGGGGDGIDILGSLGCCNWFSKSEIGITSRSQLAPQNLIVVHLDLLTATKRLTIVAPTLIIIILISVLVQLCVILN